MKNSIFGLLLALVFIQACDKNDVHVPTCENCKFSCLDINETDVITNDCFNNWECNFNVTPQSRVDINEFQGINSGDKIVFQMINITQGDLVIADDEVTTILVFELAESQSSFSVEDDGLKDMQVHYRRVCFCGEIDYMEISSGCLQGEKQSDGVWFVQGNLTVAYTFGDIDVKFDAQFIY